jgi:hypothetical protein
MPHYTGCVYRRKFRLVTVFIFTALCGCSTLSHINMRGGVGEMGPLSSTYSTPGDSGSLGLSTSPSWDLGLGYEGFFFDNLNISLERRLANFSSKALGTRVSTGATQLYLEYLFDDKRAAFPFVGLGVGTTATSFAGDDLSDTGDSYDVRGGYMWRLPRGWHAFASANYEKVERTHVDRFYYFGGAGDIRHEFWGVSVGLIFNLVRKESAPAAADATPPSASAK